MDVETLQDLAKMLLIVDMAWKLFYSILRLFLFVTAFLGFGFYLWFLTKSADQAQRRLLNILNGAVACMGFCPVLFLMYFANDELLGFLVQSEHLL